MKFDLTDKFDVLFKEIFGEDQKISRPDTWKKTKTVEVIGGGGEDLNRKADEDRGGSDR